MKCILPGRGIRAFGKAVYCLAKLGEELYIEGHKNGLALKTVNNARSAYACFLFDKNFFLSYTPKTVDDSRNNDTNDPAKCKISNKSCMSVFKSLSTLEKTVDHCRIKLDEEAAKLIFVFHCKHGIVKTHSLGYQDCDVVQAVFDKTLCTSHLKISSKIMSEVMSNFPNSLEEVTLSAESSGVSLKNYVDKSDMEEVRVSLTEVALTPSEFDSYHVSERTALTFCLKELRALLNFTDAFGQPLSVRFEAAGRPILISVEGDREYTVDLVLATLLDDSSDLPPARRPHHDATTTSTAPVPTTSTAPAPTTSIASSHTSSHNSRHHSVARGPGGLGHHQAGITRRKEDMANNEADREMEVSNEHSNVPAAVGNYSALLEEEEEEESACASDRIPTTVAKDLPFPSGSQFRKPGSSSRQLASKVKGKAGMSLAHGSSDKASNSRQVSSPCHGNVTICQNSVRVSSQNYSALTARSREEETAGMVDALFGEEGLVGAEVAGAVDTDTELQGGPSSSRMMESRVHGALDRTVPGSFSQFGRSVVNMSTPHRSAIPHIATPSHNATPPHTLNSPATENVLTPVDDDDDDDDDDDVYNCSFLPGTPPSKR